MISILLLMGLLWLPTDPVVEYGEPVPDPNETYFQQIPDSLQKDPAGTKVNQSDSLDELVPYIDEVEAKSARSLIIIYMLLIILASLMSEDLACIGAGLMAAQGLLDFTPAAIAAVAGIFIGDYGLYLAGRLLGNSVFRIRPFSWLINEEQLEKSMKWFQKKGPALLVISRFVPGSRLPVYLSAGLLKTGFWTFSLYFGLTALIWTPFFVWISSIAGHEILSYYEQYDDYALWILLASLPILYLMYKYLLPLLTPRGRRIAWKKISGFMDK